jgi:hypothetical protein
MVPGDMRDRVVKLLTACSMFLSGTVTCRNGGSNPCGSSKVTTLRYGTIIAKTFVKKVAFAL